jgi:FKBP-type peptidyl-prolyl cis-trans isomerase SlyD
MDSIQLIAKDMVVSLHYTLKDSEGEILDSSEGAEPLSYIHGYNQIVPGLETALVGKSSGASFQVVVAPAEGYGEREEEMFLSVPKSEWDLPSTVGAGDIVELSSPEGDVIPAIVVAIGDEVVQLDANHPLAGLELHFSVQVMDVRPATKDELAHGHVHGEGGCQH